MQTKQCNAATLQSMCLAASLALFLAGAASALEIPAGGSTLLNLDTTAPDPELTLAGSTVLGWGPFSLMKTNSLPPVTDTLGNVPCIRFCDTASIRSDSFLRSTNQTPLSVTGGNAWTIEIWAYSTNLWTGGGLLTWGNDQSNSGRGQAVCLKLSDDTVHGAVKHGTAADYQLNFASFPDNAPAKGEWHLLTLTYSGAAAGQRQEHLYVDGVLDNGRGNLILNVAENTDFYLGCVYRLPAGTPIEAFRGGIARVRLHTGTLTYAQIRANYNEEAAAFNRSALSPYLNDFSISGAWDNAQNWSLEHLPEDGEHSVITGTATISDTRAVGEMKIPGTLSLSGAAAALSATGTVTVSYGTGSLTLSDGAVLDATVRPSESPALLIGSPREGSLAVTNATLFVTNGLFAVGYDRYGVGVADFCNATGVFRNARIGYNGTTSNSGTLTWTNGMFSTPNSSSVLLVGDSGTGNAHFWDATVALGSSLTVGNSSNGNGTYTQRGGSLSANSHIHLGNAHSTARGNAQFENTLISTRTFSLGHSAGSGRATLINSTLSASTEVLCGNAGNGVITNIASTIGAPTVSVGNDTGGPSGRMYCDPDSVTRFGRMQVGRNGTGIVDCYGSISTVTNYSSITYYDIIVGNIANSVGTFNLYEGGTVEAAVVSMGYTQGTGTFNQYGGTARDKAELPPTGWYLGGRNTSYRNARGFYNLNGGTLTLRTKSFIIGNYGTGELTVNGGHATVSNATDGVTLGMAANSTGRVFLVSGTLAARLVKGGSGRSEFFFDGGTLSPLLANATFMRNLSAAEVRAGGAVIDTAGIDITIAQSIGHDSQANAPAKDGGLTKLGAGTLTMTGTLGFTGDLGADGGTLNLSAATYALPAGSGLWGSGTLVPPSGGFSIPSGGWVAPGGTDGLGTLTVNGNLTVNGEVRIRISTDGSTCGTLTSTGNLLFPPGSTLVIENPEDLVKGANYTFATAATFSGTPAPANLPGSWILKTDNGKIRAVYSTGTIITVL